NKEELVMLIMHICFRIVYFHLYL
ncbi:Os11g0219750, partial [Oryza sativa Japonica Group]